MKNEPQKYLGIDYGEKKIGLAIADLETKIATPFKILTNDKNILAKISQICQGEDINKIVKANWIHGKEEEILVILEKLMENKNFRQRFFKGFKLSIEEFFQLINNFMVLINIVDDEIHRYRNYWFYIYRKGHLPKKRKYFKVWINEYNNRHILYYFEHLINDDEKLLEAMLHFSSLLNSINKHMKELN